VVTGATRVREVLLPVNEALGLDWDPGTVGSLADEVPGLGWEDAAGAVERAFAERFDLRDARVDDESRSLARDLIPRHAVG
jgi:octanoyl-[GcvH]:protein N-octanoyltransferase